MVGEINARAFRALGDPTRMQIVEFLAANCCGQAAVHEDGAVEGPTAGEICCHITGAEKINSTISHHLHELADAGLIEITRQGRAMVCTLKQEALLEMSEHLARLAKSEDCGRCC